MRLNMQSEETSIIPTMWIMHSAIFSKRTSSPLYCISLTLLNQSRNSWIHIKQNGNTYTNRVRPFLTIAIDKPYKYS